MALPQTKRNALAKLQEARDHHLKASRELVAARHRRDKAIVEAREAGCTYRQIAIHAEMDASRVHQIAREQASETAVSVSGPQLDRLLQALRDSQELQ